MAKRCTILLNPFPFSPMNYRKLLAEFAGAFTLALAVRLSLVGMIPMLATPFVAALVLGIFVYTVGSVSGAHLNPAITIGLFSVRRISLTDAAGYVFAQLLGACAALLVELVLVGTSPASSVPQAVPFLIFGEVLGAFFLAMGVASVAFGKTHQAASGLVVGGSLLLGILLSASFSGGILNPAVALAAAPQMLVVYLLSPIVGAVAAFWLSKTLYEA